MSSSDAVPNVDALEEELIEDVWAYETSGPSLVSKVVAEIIGTFVLVLVGVGTALYGLAALGDGAITVGLAFGLSAVAIIIGIGHISGAHLNPAVSVGLWLAGRFPGKDVAPYILSQVIGGVLAGATLFYFANSTPLITNAKELMSGASIGYGDHSPLKFELTAGLIAEILATGLLVAVILAATSVKALKGYAPITIGLSLAILVVWTIPFTNAALNPARATATALFADGWALGQLWAWWVAPIIGAAIVGLLFRAFGPEEDIEVVEVIEVIGDEDITIK